MAPGVDEPQRLRTPLQCWHESLVSARTDPLIALSSDGAFIATDRPVPVGTPLFLELSHNGEGVRAEVDAVATTGVGPERGFAVRFVALDDEARRFIAAHLAEEQRASAPGATLLPSATGAADVGVEALGSPVAEPPPRLPTPRILMAVAPIELSADDTAAAPLSADDLATVVPDAQTPVRADAIDLPDFDVAPAFDLPATDESALTSQELDDALGIVPEMELELPAMAAMPVAAAPAAPIAAPIAAPPKTRTGPAPVPETDQTIKWARAPLAASPFSAPSSAKNPFATGDSGKRSDIAVAERTERFSPAPATAPTPVPLAVAPAKAPLAPARGFADEGPASIERTERWIRSSLPAAPTPMPARAEIDETRPWTRANLVAATPAAGTEKPAAVPPRTRTPSFAPMAAAALPQPTLPAADSAPAMPRAPMPRIASMEVPGNVSAPAIEQTQRWPAAKVRVADAPLEMPVGDVPFAQPPDMQEQTGTGSDLDALFPADGSLSEVAEPAFTAPSLDARLEVKPGLETPPALDESFEPDEAAALPPPAPALPVAQAAFAAPARPAAAPRGAPDQTPTLPASPGASAAPQLFTPFDESAAPPATPATNGAFGTAGGLLGEDDDLGVGGNAADFFGSVEVTDPGRDRGVPATAEGGFEAPDDIGPTLETAEPLELTAVDEAEPVDLGDLAADEPGAPPPGAPAALPSQVAPQVAPVFEVTDAEPIVTAEIPAEVQERLLKAALSRPTEPPPAPAPAPVAAVRTDPFFDRPRADAPPTIRPEPRPTETQPMFTLGALAHTLPPLPPPPPAMSRPPPLPARAATPVVPQQPPPRSPVAAPPAPNRTDPFFPSWSEAAASRAPAQNPFAGLTPIAPASAAAPLLGNALPLSAAPAPAATSSDASADTFFDDMAFEVAEQGPPKMPAPGEQWQVQQPATADDGIPTVVGSDLPTVVGRAATPSSTNPWLVGEPAKKI